MRKFATRETSIKIAADNAGWPVQFRFAVHAGWSRVPELWTLDHSEAPKYDHRKPETTWCVFINRCFAGCCSWTRRCAVWQQGLVESVVVCHFVDGHIGSLGIVLFIKAWLKMIFGCHYCL